MNQCDHGHETTEEVRLLPTGSGYLHGNIILCREHYGKEMQFRHDEFNDCSSFPSWENLKVYEGGK